MLVAVGHGFPRNSVARTACADTQTSVYVILPPPTDTRTQTMHGSLGES